MTKVEKLHVGGVLKFSPERLFKDARGQFLESRRDSTLDTILGEETYFPQTNFSYSQPYVIRGMHYQLGWPPCGKYIRCVQGAIYQVAVDMREGSGSLGLWCGTMLDSFTHEAVWVPAGFANGFMAMGRGAIVCYEMTAEYNEKEDRGFRYNDPDVGIKWPVQSGFVLSEKDRNAGAFKDAELWRDKAKTMLKEIEPL